MAEPPLLVVIGGPNGAGKTTTAPLLLHGALTVSHFVNADPIAQGLSFFQPESMAIAAGRVMLNRMKALAQAREDFAFETTLVGRAFAPWLKALRASGYRVHLAFLSLPTRTSPWLGSLHGSGRVAMRCLSASSGDAIRRV